MKKTGVIIHCSDSPQGRGDNAETIHRWHKQRGWDGIGYHYVILEDGTVENGRPLYWTGAHTRGKNEYIGICLIGQGKYTKEQMDSLRSLLTQLKETEIIYPYKVLGHYQVDPNKKCPMFDVKVFLVEWMDEEKREG